MTPEFKRILNQMRCGDIPNGYQKTILGIAPESWEKARIDEICKLSSGSTPRRDNAKNFSGDILWVTSGELKNREIVDTAEKVSEQAAIDSHLQMYEPGTVVIAIYGLEAAGIRGTASIVGKRCTISQACMAFTEFTNVDNSFFYYWYINNGQKIGLRYAQGTKQQNLSSDIVGSFPICFPEMEEQVNIASILTAQEEMVELRENLLFEKQQQKKYLMQMMLTGKKRFRGFNNDWQLVKARNIFKNVSDKNHCGDLEVLSSTQDMGIVPRSQVEIDIKFDEASLPAYKKVTKGDFVISLRSFQGGIEYSEYTGIISPAYTVLRNTVPICEGFYRQYFKSSDYIRRLQTGVYGIRDGKQISYDNFGAISIPYPPLDEQKAIAEMLECADKEIALLKEELELEKQKKKALMYLLLTGIVRV